MDIVTRTIRGYRYKKKRWALLQGQEGGIDARRRGGHCYKDNKGISIQKEEVGIVTRTRGGYRCKEKRWTLLQGQ